MNVVSVVNTRWWNASAFYGVFQARVLQDLGANTIVVGNAGSPPVLKAESWGLRVWDQAQVERSGLRDTPRLLHRLGRLLRAENVDVVIAHRGENFLLCALAARRHGIPVVRVRGDQRPPRRDPLSRVQHQRLTDVHVVTCRTMLERCLRYGIPRERLYLLPGGVPRPPVLGAAGSGPLRFGMFGRLSPHKGHGDVLEAFARVGLDVPWTLVIAGGPEGRITYERLRDHALRLGIHDRVELLGPVASPEDFYGRVDVGIVASYDSEVICRVGFEFMARGKPLIASAWNVLNDIVDAGRSGLLYPPRDLNALAVSIRRFLDNATLAGTMGLAARALYEEQYSPEAFGRASVGMLADAARLGKRARATPGGRQSWP